MSQRPFHHLLRTTAVTGLLALLAACGSTPQAQLPGGSSSVLLTVPVDSSDTREGIAQRYGGEVLSWLDGQAIVKVGEQALGQLEGRGVSLQNTTVSRNSTVRAPLGFATASGWNAWGSGWNAWGSGWNAWGSGWNAWSGGSTLPTLPNENRGAFMITRLMSAHAMARNFGAGIKVAVLDTGLDTAHPMFSGRLAPSAEWRDFVDNDATPAEASGSAFGHGTAVAGLVVQYAPKVTVLPVRVLGGDGVGDVSRIIQGIDWAIQRGANVINLSLGTNVDVAALRTQIDAATSRGIYVVAASGNEGSTTALNFPAAYAKSGPNAHYLISVGSANGGATVSTFTNRNANLEMLVFGESVSSAYPAQQVAQTTGTSFAAPQVSGMLALLMSETSQTSWGGLEAVLWNNGWTLSDSPGRYMFATNSLRNLPGYLLSRMRRALLVVGSTSLGSGDEAVRQMLDRMGYILTIRTGSAVQSSEASGHNVVAISSTVTAADVNTKFRNVAVPVVTWEPALYDDLGLSASEGWQIANQTQLTVPPSGHPIAGGLRTNTTLDAYNSAGVMSAGTPLPSATRVANSMGGQAVVFAYNQGAQLNGITAPARRVALHVSDLSAVNVRDRWISEWLFDSAINWASTGN